MPEEYVTIKIPRSLYEEIKKRVEESQGEFKNPQEFIEFVLTEVIKEEEEETPYTPEEEEEIKRRLKALDIYKPKPPKTPTKHAVKPKKPPFKYLTLYRNFSPQTKNHETHPIRIKENTDD